MSQEPIVGAIVHFVLPPGAAGGGGTGQVRPLIITRIWSVATGHINGKVILDGMNDIGHDDHAYTVPYNEDKTIGTWHWPDRT